MTVRAINIYGSMLANDELNVFTFDNRKAMLYDNFDCIRFPILNNIMLQRTIINIHSPWFDQESGLKPIFLEVLCKAITVFCNSILFDVDPNDEEACCYGKGVFCRTLLEYIKPNMLEKKYNLNYRFLKEIRKLTDYIDEEYTRPIAYAIFNHIEQHLRISIMEYKRVQIDGHKLTVDLLVNKEEYYG